MKLKTNILVEQGPHTLTPEFTEDNIDPLPHVVLQAPINAHATETVIRADAPTGEANARHTYAVFRDDTRDEACAVVWFQNGAVREVGINGTTNEALLYIVADRLRCFQEGKFACRENALALTKIEEALHWLMHRTLERQSRGVEGTHEK